MGRFRALRSHSKMFQEVCMAIRGTLRHFRGIARHFKVFLGPFGPFTGHSRAFLGHYEMGYYKAGHFGNGAEPCEKAWDRGDVRIGFLQ